MRKDLELYLYSMANQVKQMNTTLEKANKQIQAGILKEEECTQLKEMTAIITQNYERVVYCLYLLNKKPAWLEKLTNFFAKRKMKNFAGSDRAAVEAENSTCLDTMQKIVEEEDKQE